MAWVMQVIARSHTIEAPNRIVGHAAAATKLRQALNQLINRSPALWPTKQGMPAQVIRRYWSLWH